MDTTIDTMVYYHSPCADGMAGAWCAWQRLDHGKTKFIPSSPTVNMSVADCAGKDVYFIDILNTRQLAELSISAKSVTVIDHHVTNKAYLDTIPATANVKIIYDVNKSGSQLAWAFFNPDILAEPWFISYIGDRDLWKWQLPYSKEINMGFQAYGQLNTFDGFEELIWSDEEKMMNKFNAFGSLILEYQENMITSAYDRADCMIFTAITGQKYYCWMASCYHDIVSELGNRLTAKKLGNGSNPDFSVIYTFSPSKMTWRLSFRSTDTGADVSAIAKQLGGGGHRNASGCEITNDTFWRHFSSVEILVLPVP